MLNKIRILDFDRSVTQQEGLMRRFAPPVVDLTHWGPACRMSMTQRMADQIRRFLQPDMADAITFLGSGDFHQVSSVLLDQFEEPLSVIVFDHHPDWDILPPRLHCGSWITQVLRRRNIQKLLLIGVSSADISTPWIQTGNLRALQDDRVEIYPYRHGPTRTFCKCIPQNRSIKRRGGVWMQQIDWQELHDRPIPDFFRGVLKRLATTQVYVSIDKDCLRAPYALTNWEEGCLELSDLRQMLELILRETQLVGLDIVGDYSPPVVAGWLKALWARLDRPGTYSAKGHPLSLIRKVNEYTNISLLELVTRQPQPVREPLLA